MPVSAYILPSVKLVYVRYSGDVRMSDIQTEMSQVFSSPDYAPGMNEVGDLRDIDSCDIDFPTMLIHAQRLRARRSEHGQRNQLCLITNNDLGYGMARMFLAVAEGPDALTEVHLVDTQCEALEILGIERDSELSGFDDD